MCFTQRNVYARKKTHICGIVYTKQGGKVSTSSDSDAINL